MQDKGFTIKLFFSSLCKMRTDKKLSKFVSCNVIKLEFVKFLFLNN